MTDWPRESCAFEPGSAVDPVGRVFRREGRVFRAISAPYGAFVRDLVDRAAAEGWSSRGLVTTWHTDARVEGYESVIEHERVPFVTLRGEWSFEGLRAAGLCILRLNAALVRAGFCLKDSHPWNVLFDAARPRFVDWGSIRPVDELHWDFWYAQFRQYVIAPLHLFSTGRQKLARALAREHHIGVGNELMEHPRLRGLPREPAGIAREAQARGIASALDALADYLASLALPDPHGEWAQYPQPPFAGLDNVAGLRLKDRIVLEALRGDDARSVLDLGANHGLHSRMAAALGKRVIAADVEEACLNRLFLEVARTGEDILPLHHDFLWPLGDSGILNSIPSSIERLRCDTVLAMAITHHLALRRGVSFEALAAGIHALARRRAVVEFVPGDDVHVAGWTALHRDGYTLERFVAAMSRHFESHRIIPSDPAPRVVIVFDGARPR